MSEPRLHVLEDPAAARRGAARRPGSHRRIDRAHRRLDTGPRLRARRGGGAELAPRLSVVGRRALRAGCRTSARTTGSRGGRCSTGSPTFRRCTGSAGSCRPARRRRSTTRRSPGVALDLLLLGLGPDAHVASLFPGSPQLAERSRLVTHGPAGLEPFVERVTLTLPALLAARRIVVPRGRRRQGRVRSSAHSSARSTRPPPRASSATGQTPIEVYLDAAAAGTHASA